MRLRVKYLGYMSYFFDDVLFLASYFRERKNMVFRKNKIAGISKINLMYTSPFLSITTSACPDESYKLYCSYYFHREVSNG